MATLVCSTRYEEVCERSPVPVCPPSTVQILPRRGCNNLEEDGSAFLVELQTTNVFKTTAVKHRGLKCAKHCSKRNKLSTLALKL